MSEVSLDTSNYDAYENYEFENSERKEPESQLHVGIFSQENLPRQFSRNVHQLKHTDPKITALALKPLMAKAGGEIKVEVSWGGEDGVEVSGSASASASDDSGNTAEVSVEVNDDGSGSASVSVKHEEDS